MKKKITYRIVLVFTIISFCCLNVRILAQNDSSDEADSVSLGELLEEGIYLQETKNAFDEAIEVYTKLIEAGKPFEAEAHYRMGMCYEALGHNVEAQTTFQKVVDNYPQETSWVEAAKAQLPGVLKPLPAPWEDGERLHMRVTLPGGGHALDQMLTVKKSERDGNPIWRFDSRSHGLASMHSFVDVDPETYRPLFSHWFHPGLGDANALYDDESVKIEFKDKPEPLVIETEGPVYDNEQAIYLFRQLPFEVGKSWNIKILPILTGTMLELKVEVMDREMVSVPAGEFECYKVFIHFLKQTLWYSVDAPHYPVKFEAGPTGELVEISRTNPGESKTYINDNFGISLVIPDDWYVLESSKRETRLWLIDSDATGKNNRIDRKAIVSYPEREAESVDSLAKYIIKNGKDKYGNFEVREDATETFELAGSPAISFVVDYVDGAGKTLTRRVVAVVGNTQVMKFTSNTLKEDHDSYQPSIDAVINSFEWL